MSSFDFLWPNEPTKKNSGLKQSSSFDLDGGFQVWENDPRVNFCVEADVQAENAQFRRLDLEIGKTILC